MATNRSGRTGGQAEELRCFAAVLKLYFDFDHRLTTHLLSICHSFTMQNILCCKCTFAISFYSSSPFLSFFMMWPNASYLRNPKDVHFASERDFCSIWVVKTTCRQVSYPTEYKANRASVCLLYCGGLPTVDQHTSFWA